MSDRPNPCIPKDGPIAATTACGLSEFTTGAGTQSMDLIRIFGGIALVIFVLYHWTNWRERCREYPNYLAHPAPPNGPPAADRRHFTRLWRRYHGGYLDYSLPHPGKKGDVLSLGAYIRSRELGEAATMPAPQSSDRRSP